MKAYLLILFIFSTINCQLEFTGLLCKNTEPYSQEDFCTVCTRDPNKYVDCAKIVMERFADDFFYFHCFTDSDLQTGQGPTRSQQVSINDEYQNLLLLCETSIPYKKLYNYITNDKCQVQRVGDPYDSYWYHDCVESHYKCGAMSFPMRYGNEYMSLIASLCNTTSNEAQEFFKLFNKCLKTNISMIYLKENGTCQEIDQIAEMSYTKCFEEQNLCALINNYERLPGFFPSFAELHNVKDLMVQKLLQSVLREAKNCGDKTYNLLKRMWKGFVIEPTLVFLEDV